MDKSCNNKYRNPCVRAKWRSIGIAMIMVAIGMVLTVLISSKLLEWVVFAVLLIGGIYIVLEYGM